MISFHEKSSGFTNVYVHLRQSIYIKVAQIKNLHMEPEIREKLLRNSKNA